MSTFLALKNVHKYFQAKGHRIDALKGVSLDINQGEIMSLLGVNGAGKTTMSSIIASLIPATEGEVLFKGTSIYDNLLEYRRSLGFCPQKPNYDKKLNIEENLYFSGRYYGLSKTETKERVSLLMEQFELTKYAKDQATILSGGYKQRLIIARSLVHRPSLLILDEPTVGLDPHIRRDLWDKIIELKKQGVTVLITTHYLDEAEVLSDRVCILDKGVIRMVETPEALMSSYNKDKLEDVFLELMKEN